MLRTALLCCALLLAPLGHAQNFRTLLDAGFDDKPLGQPIGTGGAALGEPIQLTTGLATEVVASPPGRALALTTTNTAASQRATFELIGSEEVRSGPVRIELRLEPATLSSYQVSVREQGGAASAFLNLSLSATGQIRANWAGNLAGVAVGSYTAGSAIDLLMVFDMDTGRFTLSRDGTPVLVDQAHGVTSGRGIGRVNVGFAPSAPSAGPLRVDRLRVQRSMPLEAVLAADFDDKPLDQQIGTGGALLGEPVSFDEARMSAIVVAASPGRALRLRRLDTPSNTAAASLHFDFVDNAEINSGPLRIDLLLNFQQLGSYAVRTRENGGAAIRWLDLEFSAAGEIRRQVRNGTSSVVGSYTAGQPLQLTVIGDFDARTYRVLLNGSQIDAGSFDANARGVGRLLFSFLSGTANFDKAFVVDDILVQRAPVPIFRNGFE